MIPFIDVDLTPTETREALRDVLQGDFDPADDATRLGVPAGTGQLLAVGSHTTDARELDDTLMHRSVVAVESVHTALAEAGDVVLAGLGEEDLVTMKQLVNDPAAYRADDRPMVFKGTGMSWMDVTAATGWGAPVSDLEWDPAWGPGSSSGWSPADPPDRRFSTPGTCRAGRLHRTGYRGCCTPAPVRRCASSNPTAGSRCFYSHPSYLRRPRSGTRCRSGRKSSWRSLPPQHHGSRIAEECERYRRAGSSN